jgi:hypothetical protein
VTGGRDLVENSLSGRVIARLKREWGKRSFDRAARGILTTRPLHLRGDSPLFLSMICHPDVTAYLLAIKSLYVGVGQGRVVIINDGSLTSDDVAILHRHIPGIEKLDIATISTGACPRRGTWERLVKIVELSAGNYVIQADADILVSAPIPEVIQCWRDNRSFLLGTDVGQQVSPAPNTARMVQGWIKTYDRNPISIGVQAEALLDTLPDAAHKSYVHASSGFAGFARGVFAVADLERFSAHMSGILGVERWSRWGTEQIGSNYILANAPEAAVLPFPRYACFEPHLEKGEYALLHFIGAYRYRSGVYRQRAAEFISYYERQRGDLANAVG